MWAFRPPSMLLSMNVIKASIIEIKQHPERKYLLWVLLATMQ